MAAVPPHERPRERLLERGAEAMTDRELLALVLGGGVRGTSALDLAAALIADHGGLAGLATARAEELARYPGVGLARAAAVVAAFGLGRRATMAVEISATIRTAGDAAAAAAGLLDGARRERLVVLICDSANRLRHRVVVTEGSLDRSAAPVREILNAVLRHDGRAFAIAHNHPSGDPEPSDADHRATEAVRAAAGVAGLRFLGHVVLAGSTWQAVT